MIAPFPVAVSFIFSARSVSGSGPGNSSYCHIDNKRSVKNICFIGCVQLILQRSSCIVLVTVSATGAI
jgi:hypothetical protein